MHLIGKNIKYYGVDHVIWGTDCLWWGSPQWVIDAFKRFQISRRTLREVRLQQADQGRQGQDLRPECGQDLRRRCPRPSATPCPRTRFTKLKQAYLDNGGLRDNAAYGWVRADA